MTTTEPTRLLALDGRFNFRDLGGYATVDGRMTRWRRLFRADGPHDLTERDTAALGDLGLATILDLRTAGESEQRGQYHTHVGNATYHHIPMTDVLPDEAEMSGWGDPKRVGEHYAVMATRGVDAIVTAVRTLARADALPAVFHCSASKDRTGVLAALLLGFFGVPDETIVVDYALSRDAMVRLMTWLEGRVEDPDQLARYAPAIRAAEPRTMAVFLENLHGEYGSFDGVAAALRVSSEVAVLRDALLA